MDMIKEIFKKGNYTLIGKINIGILGVILIVTIIIELKTGLIYDQITLPGIIIGLLIGIKDKSIKYRFLSLLTSFGFFVLIVILMKGTSLNLDIGGGTFKLMFMVSAFTTVSFTVFTWVIVPSIFSIFNIFALNSEYFTIPFIFSPSVLESGGYNSSPIITLTVFALSLIIMLK